MTCTYYYGGVDIGNVAIRLGSINGLAMNADQGTVAGSTIIVDDPSGTRSFSALRTFKVVEYASGSPKTIYFGFGAGREVSHGPPSFLTGTSRRWEISLVDANTVFSNRVLFRAAARRPAETDIARVNYGLSTTQLSGPPVVFDNGQVASTGGIAMDANDYIGSYYIDFFNDCAGAAGRQFFVYWDNAQAAGHELSLFYNLPTLATFTSTLTISNVRTDLSSTCFSPQKNYTITRDPSQLYSQAYARYLNGWVSQLSGGATVSRDVVLPQWHTHSRSVALARTQTALAQMQSEVIIVECVIQVPASQAHLVQAGQRIQVKFSEDPTLSTPTYLRITQCAFAQDEENDQQWNVHIRAQTSVIAKTTGGTSLPDNTTNPPANNSPFVPTSAGYVAVIEGDGATHIWPLSEATGPAIDIVLGENGTYHNLNADMTRAVAGPGTIAGSGGVQTTGLGTPGSNVTIDDGGAQLPSGNSDRSFEFWFKFVTGFLGSATFQYGNGVNSYSMAWSGVNGPGNVAVAADSGLSLTFTVSNTIHDGNWHMLTFTYDSSTFLQSVYFDGALAGSANFAHAINTDTSGGTSGLVFQAPPSQTYVQSYSSAAETLWTSAQVANHALGDAAVGGTIPPTLGQPVAGELVGTGNGTTTAYTTNYDYAPGSLHVTVCGIPQVITETSPSAGTFTLATPAPTGCPIIAQYTTPTATATGSSNPLPTPATTTVAGTSKLLTNKSGGSVAAGDVVIIDTTNNDAFTTTTSAAATKIVGVVQATIASNAVGPVALEGYVPLVNVQASVTRGNYAETYTVAKQATQNATRHAGSFAQFLTGGTTPDAILFGVPDSSGGGGSTSPLTTKGDIWGFSTVDARVPIGTDTWVLTADSSQALGLKWAAAGGGGGSTIQYPHLKAGSLAATYGDDFSAASLDGKWVAQQNSGTFTTARVFTQGYDGSSVGISMSAASGLIREAGPAGDFEFHAGGLWGNGLVHTTNIWPGITILDSTGTGVSIALDDDGNVYFLNMTSYKYDNGSAIGTIMTGGSRDNTSQWWMRITKVGTTYDAYASLSGYGWDFHSNATKTSSITVAYLGIGDMKGTNTTNSAIIYADYVDKQ